MTETWLPIATERKGPVAKQGYASAPSREVAAIEGQVMHSMEGYLGGAMAELGNPDRRASWTFSVCRNGIIYQHYPLESVTWASGSKEANTRFVGVEHEGIAGMALTEDQYQSALQLTREIHRLCDLTPERRVTLWEHREMTAYGSSPTACPSGRIPWERLMTDLVQAEEADMTPEQDAMLRRCEAKLDLLLGPGDNWIVDQINGQLKAALRAASDAIKVPIEEV